MQIRTCETVGFLYFIPFSSHILLIFFHLQGEGWAWPWPGPALEYEGQGQKWLARPSRARSGASKIRLRASPARPVDSLTITTIISGRAIQVLPSFIKR